ncbi:MAG: 50S ribosome-binding GTPase [Candidatus Aenigmarchaeota archaeon]|nr:50S ribosome-binding GTPase [Candidatus Aenigmarchaeota archaeon]
MSIVPQKENKNIEFKEKLTPSIHLKDIKKQHLASQMKYLLEIGNGTAVYVIGVDDDGKSKGLSELDFEETMSVLKVIAIENNARIEKVEKFSDNGGLVGKLIIVKASENGIKNHLVVASAGHVNAGKSTIIGTLMTGKPDTSGKHWLYLDTLPHEIERNLSADLHYALFGFKHGKPIHLKNPLDKKERARVAEGSDKLISFIDTVGHEPWVKTTIRGLVGQNIDYGLLVVATDDGVTHITKEHLGLLIAMNIPVIVCLTKIDRASKRKIEETETQIDELLKNIGRIPYNIKDENDLNVTIDKLDTIVPILKTSSVTLEGYDLLKKFLLDLPERRKNFSKPLIMFIDKIYNVSGVGTVVSGTIKQGKLQAGKELMLGPDEEGKFRRVKATSIETHYHRVTEADTGFVVGIALRGVNYDDLERGMILCETAPKVVKSFEADILVLTHPTRITDGYEPVIHVATVAESARVELTGKDYLKAGETGNVKFTFKYSPHYMEEGDRFIFREGKTKGIGTVTKVLS